MKINLNIKIECGKRTPLKISVQRTSVNEKILRLPNGCCLNESEIAAGIKKVTAHYLYRFEKI